jgi:uncharacterized membrane protein
MGAVHGVHLKYVALSAMSATGAFYASDGDGVASTWSASNAELAIYLLLAYVAVVNGIIGLAQRPQNPPRHAARRTP